MEAPCVSLWIGESLGPVERACLTSVVAQGHPLTLYCYKQPSGVPRGVDLRDAAAIIPEDRIVRYRGGSVALFSNWFRYELQRRGLGIWVDCDVYLVAPIAAQNEHLFGEQTPGILNSAVLRLPRKSPMLAPLIALFDERVVPDWLPLGARFGARWRMLRRGRSGLAQMPWGSTGPHALTAIARRCGLLDEALSPEIFYPVRWQDAAWIADPGVQLADMVTARTIAVHLWNECIKRFKNDPAAPGSFLERLQIEGRA